MMRKLGIILLSGAVCLAIGTSALAVKYNEASVLKIEVAAGKLPSIEERLPEEPLVVKPVEEIGQYGGQAYVARVEHWWWHNAYYMVGDEGFARFSPDFKTMLPNLAKGWKFSEDKKDLTIYLRKGVKWSDGAPFTADDIMFWYQDVLLNKELTPVFPREFTSPDGEPMVIEKKDDYIFSFHFSTPYAILELMICRYLPLTPAHYLRQFHIKYNPKADELAKEEAFDYWYQLFQQKAFNHGGIPLEDPDLPTLNSFRLKERGTDISILERNPYYWKIDTAGNQLPYIDRIVVKQLANWQIYLTQIPTGQFDFAEDHVNFANYPLYKENEARGDYRVVLWNKGMGSERVYQVNMTYEEDPILRDIFRDVRFRRALSLAINREEINETFYFGLGVPRQMTIATPSRYFEEEFARAYAEYNPEEANRLLDEMGLKWDENHEYRLRPDGKKLSWILNFPMEDKPTELVVEYWKKIGIDVPLKVISPALIGERNMGNTSSMSAWEGSEGSNDINFPRLRKWFVPLLFRSTAWCPLWARWYETDGKEGEEPPQEIKNLFEWQEKLQATMDVEWGKKILSCQAENIWTIGTVGMVPFCVLARSNLCNIPKKDIIFDVAGSISCPEQYFFKEK